MLIPPDEDVGGSNPTPGSTSANTPKSAAPGVTTETDLKPASSAEEEFKALKQDFNEQAKQTEKTKDEIDEKRKSGLPEWHPGRPLMKEDVKRLEEEKGKLENIAKQIVKLLDDNPNLSDSNGKKNLFKGMDQKLAECGCQSIKKLTGNEAKDESLLGRAKSMLQTAFQKVKEAISPAKEVKGENKSDKQDQSENANAINQLVLAKVLPPSKITGDTLHATKNPTISAPENNNDNDDDPVLPSFHEDPGSVANPVIAAEAKQLKDPGNTQTDMMPVENEPESNINPDSSMKEFNYKYFVPDPKEEPEPSEEKKEDKLTEETDTDATKLGEQIEDKGESKELNDNNFDGNAFKDVTSEVQGTSDFAGVLDQKEGSDKNQSPESGGENPSPESLPSSESLGAGEGLSAETGAAATIVDPVFRTI